jgi:cobalt/nickel transport system ATP-binding protein
VSFKVKAGESIGLIGPNGAGKSTIFLHLMGFLKPLEGTIQMFNQELNKKTIKAIRKRIGMVFQDPNDQLFSPSIWEDIAFGPFNLDYNENEINDRVEKTLRILDLEEHRNKAPHHLSFGEKKRAAFATILSMDPEILLLDEPFSNLDPMSYMKLLEIIQKYRKEHLTIVLATHDVDILPYLVDRCILLDKGQVVCEDTTRNILTNNDLLLQHKMRMPLIGELFYNLKKRNIIQSDNLPLTLGEAEELLEHMIKD